MDHKLPSSTRRNYIALIPKTNELNIVSHEFAPNPIKKRSRNGCTNCKRLKIKCSEDKPECEYCIQTGKHCIYLNSETSKAKKNQKLAISNQQKRTDTGLSNKSLQKINSATCQLDISKFELQLLKFYLEFGGSFFSLETSSKYYSFWCDDVPKLWCSSDVIKYALYSVSCARLLANYGYDTSKEIYIENENQDSTSAMPFTITLNDQALKYLKKTLEMIELYQLLIDGQSVDSKETEDLLGQLAIATKLSVGSKVILPRPKKIKEITKVKDLSIIEFMTTTGASLQCFDKYSLFLKQSKYSGVFEPEAIPIEEYNRKFNNYEIVLVKHLEYYISQRISASDDSQITYQSAISKLEASCFQTLYFRYTIALFRAVVHLSMDNDFVNLLKEEDHTAMKIMFYICCLNSIFHYQSYQRDGIQNEFLEFYIKYSREKFNENEGWEDDIDKNAYEWVIARSKSDRAYSLDVLRYVGEPVDKFLEAGILLSHDHN
ncbi:hypothetical protein WICANDRAFT_59667 [Wickerhamomyces anomalus NRRL Y-366-8]|uniref:Zn(2)-C6 fungal-type domain-containing protein n=1 Tax=Wickerhamomyces anomalus (strain ATCC 58044 / CBS 1984 / NCYC 433 / NRRL Y-366-8) TaxID=683960 RepID=A0A1E3P9E8_WICAA|nr:uncharacterized protein WICANDRAFT_59667 [Wickerhamomyces anomalus NRRL Y-366-8]ODQ61582.1 hypothetical protein WICANDRAFT_59667 [Wickerhamomyces anomalus NRRL Y-366-8]